MYKTTEQRMVAITYSQLLLYLYYSLIKQNKDVLVTLDNLFAQMIHKITPKMYLMHKYTEK